MLLSHKIVIFLPTIAVLTLVVYLDHSFKEVLPEKNSIPRISPEQQDRITKIDYVCAYGNVSQPLRESSLPSKMIYSKYYNLAYINMPKVGSTFLKQMFHILNYGVKEAPDVFSTPRAVVHGLTKKLKAKRTNFYKSLTLITVRNPYTRLFSAYIDKIYLPISLPLRKAVAYDSLLVRTMRRNCTRTNTTKNYEKEISEMRKALACPRNISFDDFLQYVTADGESLHGKPLFDHYAPCTQMMSKSICKSGQKFVLKQETFSDDVKYLLQLIDVSDEVYDTIDTYLHAKRAETNIKGVVQTAYKIVKKETTTRKCWTMFEVAERFWKTFQIQGYIKDSSKFPKHLFSDADRGPGHLISVILGEIKDNPISEFDSKAQRHRAFMKAYETVNDTVISKIQEMYALDFEMFDYDITSF